MLNPLSTLNDILDHFEFTLKESSLAMSIAEKKDNTIIQQFCLCLLHRVNSATEGIKPAFGKYLEDRKFDFVIGITIRAILLDNLIVLNAMEICLKYRNEPETLEKELNEFCLIMLSDTARHTLNYFKANQRYITQDMLANMYKSLVKTNPDCFHTYTNDGTAPELKISKFYRTADLVKNLKQSEHIGYMGKKENPYMYYSKYDHFGQMYYHLAKRQLPEEFYIMEDAISEFPRIVAYSSVLLSALYPEESELSALAERGRKYVQNIDDTRPLKDKTFAGK